MRANGLTAALGLWRNTRRGRSEPNYDVDFAILCFIARHRRLQAFLETRFDPAARHIDDLFLAKGARRLLSGWFRDLLRIVGVLARTVVVVPVQQTLAASLVTRSGPVVTSVVTSRAAVTPTFAQVIDVVFHVPILGKGWSATGVLSQLDGFLTARVMLHL